MNAQSHPSENNSLPSAADAVRTLLDLQGIAVTDIEALALAKTLERLAPSRESRS